MSLLFLHYTYTISTYGTITEIEASKGFRKMKISLEIAQKKKLKFAKTEKHQVKDTTELEILLIEICQQQSNIFFYL